MFLGVVSLVVVFGNVCEGPPLPTSCCPMLSMLGEAAAALKRHRRLRVCVPCGCTCVVVIWNCIKMVGVISGAALSVVFFLSVVAIRERC